MHSGTTFSAASGEVWNLGMLSRKLLEIEEKSQIIRKLPSIVDLVKHETSRTWIAKTGNEN